MIRVKQVFNFERSGSAYSRLRCATESMLADKGAQDDVEGAALDAPAAFRDVHDMSTL